MAHFLLRLVLIVSSAQLSRTSDHHSHKSHARLVKKLTSRSLAPTNHSLIVPLQERATPVLPSGWAYQACVREAPGRTLNGYSFVSSSLTIDLCVSTCASKGYSMAGAEFHNECYCGNSFAGTADGGGSVAPESECNTPCAGDSSQTCGGGYRLSVYANNQVTPGTPVLPPGWSPISKCITDASTRALVGNSLTSQSMTLDMCIDLCDQTGFKYAGAEYSAECYCSNTISTANGAGVEVPASDCNMNCAGNPNQKCGAGYRLTLYTKTATNNIPSGWIKDFCTIDQDNRVLNEYVYTSNNAMTPANCINTCSQQGFVLAGVENGNECWCGNNVNQAFPTKDADCTKPCSGDQSQGCGGGWRLLVYKKIPNPSGPNAWTLTSGGNSGIVMTHIAVTTSDTALIIDRKENNPLKKADGLPAIAGVWNLNSNSARALSTSTHSFCSTGNWLSNGTMANFGGHPYTDRDGEASPDGQQGVRLFNPCAANQNCDIYENPTRVRLSTPRWYPASARLHDGSVIIIGGMITASFTNSPGQNSPSYEFFPAKNINGYNGLPIPLQFLIDTLPHNTYPHVRALPSKKIMIAANNKAIVLDWEHNTVSSLPNFPNGQRVAYPMSATSVMLPLTPANGYTPEVLFCGGSQLSDALQGDQMNANHDYATTQCSRMVLTDAGIAAGWQVEHMPEPRIMPDGIILPNGKILIVNGGRTGTAGYGNLQYRIGDSNADNPNFTPVLYDPALPAGHRFSEVDMPTSNIPRLYHSVATLLPSGAILLGGSNPNDDVETRPYASEYRVEYLNPSYMFGPRPSFSNLPTNIFCGQPFTLSITIPSSTSTIKVVLMDLGFVTHSGHFDQKLVELVSTVSADRQSVTVTGPPSAPIYSPGPGWIFVLSDDIPSVGQKVMVGDGSSPPEDDAATANMLANTSGPQ